MSRRILSFRLVATVVLTLGVLILGAINVQQKRIWVAPDDGCSWVQTPLGIQARFVVDEGPADRAGILAGDVLKAINGQPVQSDRHDSPQASAGGGAVARRKCGASDGPALRPGDGLRRRTNLLQLASQSSNLVDQFSNDLGAHGLLSAETLAVVQRLET